MKIKRSELKKLIREEINEERVNKKTLKQLLSDLKDRQWLPAMDNKTREALITIVTDRMNGPMPR